MRMKCVDHSSLPPCDLPVQCVSRPNELDQLFDQTQQNSDFDICRLVLEVARYSKIYCMSFSSQNPVFYLCLFPPGVTGGVTLYVESIMQCQCPSPCIEFCLPEGSLSFQSIYIADKKTSHQEGTNTISQYVYSGQVLFQLHTNQYMNF